MDSPSACMFPLMLSPFYYNQVLVDHQMISVRKSKFVMSIIILLISWYFMCSYVDTAGIPKHMQGG